MSNRRRWIAFPLLALCFIEAGPALASDHVLSLVDYFAQGREAVRTYLEDSRQDDLLAAMERARHLCARVEIRTRTGQDSYRSVGASAVLIDGGRRAVTAAHSFSGQLGFDVRLILPDGQSLQARLGEQQGKTVHGDWVILEVVDPPLDLPAPAIGQAKENDMAFVLGYPDQLGVDANGQVAYALDGGPLQPLATLARVANPAPLTLRPEAGAIPTGGMSGGAVFDRQGRLLGIFTAIAQTRADGRMRFTYRAESLESLVEDVRASR